MSHVWATVMTQAECFLGIYVYYDFDIKTKIAIFKLILSTEILFIFSPFIRPIYKIIHTMPSCLGFFNICNYLWNITKQAKAVNIPKYIYHAYLNIFKHKHKQTKVEVYYDLAFLKEYYQITSYVINQRSFMF